MHVNLGAPVLNFLFQFLIPCFGRVWARSKLFFTYNVIKKDASRTVCGAPVLISYSLNFLIYARTVYKSTYACYNVYIYI